MNIVVFSKRWANARHYELGHPLAIAMVFLAVLMLFGGAFLLGTQWGASSTRLSMPDTQLSTGKVGAVNPLQDQLTDLATRVGQVNAQLLRLNALGKRLTALANLDKGEFNFDEPPAQGGPELDKSEQVTGDAFAESGGSAVELQAVLSQLENRLIDRERQLVILETFISARQLTRMALPDGNPVPGAWISSGFGSRVDPFTGSSAFHSGVDFAASLGARVVSVAPGVVTWAGERSGYGQLVEINHGNGYVTRYGHNSRVLVKVGDKVSKGQAVSQVGSTGRSTGPHLHFEVLKNGQAVNPARFVAG